MEGVNPLQGSPDPEIRVGRHDTCEWNAHSGRSVEVSNSYRDGLRRDGPRRLRLAQRRLRLLQPFHKHFGIQVGGIHLIVID